VSKVSEQLVPCADEQICESLENIKRLINELANIHKKMTYKVHELKSASEPIENTV
jgi:K+/H+ antiporter YhaU regulatory subunit KhtT